MAIRFTSIRLSVRAPANGNAPTYNANPAQPPTGLRSARLRQRRLTAQAALLTSATRSSTSVITSGDIKVNAHLFPNLWNGGIDLRLGYEHREINQQTVPDPVQAAGDQLGFNQAA